MRLDVHQPWCELPPNRGGSCTFSTHRSCCCRRSDVCERGHDCLPNWQRGFEYRRPIYTPTRWHGASGAIGSRERWRGWSRRATLSSERVPDRACRRGRKSSRPRPRPGRSGVVMSGRGGSMPDSRDLVRLLPWTRPTASADVPTPLSAVGWFLRRLLRSLERGESRRPDVTDSATGERRYLR